MRRQKGLALKLDGHEVETLFEIFDAAETGTQLHIPIALENLRKIVLHEISVQGWNR